MDDRNDPAARNGSDARLRGILPPIAMPFDHAGRLLLSGLKAQVDFIMGAGAHGIVPGGSIGEGHTLSGPEFAEAVTAAHDALAGRGLLIPGLIVNSTFEAVERAGLIAGLKVDALQVTPVHYLFKPDADATIEHFRTIHGETGLPILIYNVIPWNYLSVDLMLRIMDEVPGVVGIKQSNSDLKSLSDLVQRTKQHQTVLSGIDALIYPALALGADGCISAMTAALPAQTVAAWKAVLDGRHDDALDLHWKLNTVWNAMSHDNLPACVKYVQAKQGLPFHQSRAPMTALGSDQRARIDAALAGTFL